MATAWEETTGRAVANIAETRLGRASSDYAPTLRETDGETKPSKPTLAVVYEFGLRWPCPKDVDPDRYDARLRLLARDVIEMAPGLLRKAGDRVARIPGRPNVLPSASELHQAANDLIAERAAKQAAESRQAAADRGAPVRQTDDKAAARAEGNLDAIKAGQRFMLTPSGESFMLGSPGEMRGVRRDGSAIEPFFRRAGEVKGVPSGWFVNRDDAEVLDACYRHYGAQFTVRGAQIFRVNAQ